MFCMFVLGFTRSLRFGLTVARGVSTGHRSSVTTVDVHPYGSFFCSASTDTNVKV
jgi:hypothetical protein